MSLRIGIVKPDYRIEGGFERVLDRLGGHIESRGDTVETVLVDATAPSRTPYELDVPEPVWASAPEYFTHLSLSEAFAALDLTRFDLVVSTQPPSYAVDHPRHLALFYHHLRRYYDLAGAHADSFGVPPSLHETTVAAVRSVDQPHLDAVGHFLAGSHEVKRRLADFNGIVDDVSLFTAGPSVEIENAPGPLDPAGPVLCVSRFEWPKRTELVVHALALLGDVPGVLVGEGGRRPFNEQLAATLDPERDVDDASLWRNDGLARGVDGPPHEQISFVGHVSDARLDRLYGTAGCVVAPAFREDYGLTALEAMSRGRPLIVCSDGGGLVEFVEPGVTGLVVEPTGAAIAEAIRSLREDPAHTAAMADAARDAAAAYTWNRAFTQFDVAIETTMEGHA